MTEAVTESLTSPRPRSSKLRRRAGSAVLAIVAPVAVLWADSSIAHSISYRDTIVAAMSNSENEHLPQYDPNSATVFLNGYGEDVSCEQAEAMRPVVGKYGRVLCMVYSSEYDAVAAADKLYETIADGRSNNDTLYLTILTGSMGDKRGYQIGQEIGKRPNVALEGLIMNTGAGPFGNSRVKNKIARDNINHICTKAPGKLAMAGLEVLIETSQGKTINDGGDVWEMLQRGVAYNNRVLQNQSCTLPNVLPNTPTKQPAFRLVCYLLPDNPANDTIIDTIGAAEDWRQFFPDLQVIQVSGNVTHDNVRHRPEQFLPIMSILFEGMHATRERIEHPVKNSRVR